MNEAGIFTQVRDVPDGLLLDRASLGRRVSALGVYHGRSGQPKNRNLSLQSPEGVGAAGGGSGWSHTIDGLFSGRQTHLPHNFWSFNSLEGKPRKTLCPFSKHRPDF